MMRSASRHLSWALLAAAASAAVVAGCNTSSVPQLDWQPSPSGADADGGGAADAGTAGDGLPCAVAELLASHCQSCHSAHPSAPMSLLCFADLDAPSKSNPARKVYEVALERISSTTSPMPPSAPMSADDIAVLAGWVHAGAAKATCAAGGREGGARDASGPECALASDCPGALICRAGVCDVECVTAKDCPATFHCEETRCQPPSPSADGGVVATYRNIADGAGWSSTTLAGSSAGSYSGTIFDGRYVYFAPDSAGGAVLRYDTTLAFGSTRAWSTFDLTSMNAVAKNYRGAVFDGRYVYLVPSSAGATLARYDTHAPYRDASSWTLVDLKSVSGTVSFTGGSFDGRYLYLAPSPDASVTLRYDTTGTMTDAASWAAFRIPSVDPRALSFVGSVTDGRYVYFVPNGGAAGPAGVVARYDADSPFQQASSWSTLDLATLNSKALGYRTAAFDGRYLYLVPGWTAPNPSWATSTLARYDTQAAFAAAESWKFFDTAQVDPGAVGFNAAAFDGRHLILAPGFNGAYHGEALSYDTQADLTAPTSWSMFDTTTVSPAAKNMRGTSFDGRYVYFAPASAIAVRFEARPGGAAAPSSVLGGSFY